MTETPPPSWRDVANGRFEVDPKALPSYEPDAAAPAAATASVPELPIEDERGGSARTWAVALVVALVAGGAGFAAGTLTDPFGDDSDRQLRAAELSSLDDDLSSREQALAQERKALTKGQRKLRKRVKAANQRAKALDGRQRELAAAEQVLEEQSSLADTIVGDGVFEVGADVLAGTYRVSGGSDSCTWVVRTAEQGGEVLVDESVTGGAEASVTLLDGRFFETSACGDWSLED